MDLSFPPSLKGTSNPWSRLSVPKLSLYSVWGLTLFSTMSTQVFPSHLLFPVPIMCLDTVTPLLILTEPIVQSFLGGVFNSALFSSILAHPCLVSLAQHQVYQSKSRGCMLTRTFAWLGNLRTHRSALCLLFPQGSKIVLTSLSGTWHRQAYFQ